ncbi:BatA domain-containing protein [uncultured Spirosoma sp.]|uniref:BatA domain-containing protein n=1 Tax=uncultured Spirosoma sp. TaxID=278208 RepID=UPI0025904ABC|nr:BatA domain-containing protein [uncultured Spirosoma sp.]
MNEPYMLWGALAVVIPIAIHFWHRKQGKPLPWAATGWLEKKQQQQSRGLRFDDRWLLLVRCLLVVLLAVLLAQPMLPSLSKPPIVQTVHLVQPSAAVVDNFRFELSEALKRKERVVWATPALPPVPPALTLPAQTEFNPLVLQTAISRLSTQPISLQLYATNTPTLATLPIIAVPTRFALHTVIDSSQSPRPYLLVNNDRRLYINRAGQLTSTATPDGSVRLALSPAHTGPVPTLLSYRNEREKQTVQAALAALTDVYGIDFQLDARPVPGRVYSWILTDQLPAQRMASTRYIISPVSTKVGASTGVAMDAAMANVVYTNDVLTPTTSTLVETGQLPEWLGMQLLAQFDLNTTTTPLSQQALRSLFTPGQPVPKQAATDWQQLLVLLFISMVILERWLALSGTVRERAARPTNV